MRTLRTLVRASSYPAEVIVLTDGELYYYTAAFEDIILSDTAQTITEAAEDIVTFIVLWTARKGYTFGVVRDIAEPLSVAVALETGQQPKTVYRNLVGGFSR